MKRRIFWAIFGVCFIWALLGLWASLFFFKDYYEKQIALHLKQSSHYIATGLKQYGIDYILQTDSTYRISLLDSEGNVLYDSVAHPDSLDNHATRDEFIESMEYGSAQSYRFSTTTQHDTIYYALKVTLPSSTLHAPPEKKQHFSSFFLEHGSLDSQPLTHSGEPRGLGRNIDLQPNSLQPQPYNGEITMGNIFDSQSQSLRSQASQPAQSSVDSQPPLTWVGADFRAHVLASQPFVMLSEAKHLCYTSCKDSSFATQERHGKDSQGTTSHTKPCIHPNCGVDSHNPALSNEAQYPTMETHNTLATQEQHNTDSQTYILRIASPHKHIGTLLYEAMPYIIMGLFLCLLMSFALARALAASIIAPLNALRLDNPLALKSYQELQPLLCKIDEQNTLICHQIKQLKAKQEEFSAITQNMEEGFLLLDTKGNILSFNKSSMRLFGELSEGMNIESLDSCYKEWFILALKGGRYKHNMERNGATYQIILESVFERVSADSPNTPSQIHHNAAQHTNTDSSQEAHGESPLLKQPIGVAIIISDITEKAQRERLRREFSTNVSHELKTPLTSIVGVIEMLQNNLIKQDDMPKFLGNMHKEAKHLMNLIEDIIILNDLDNDYTFMPCPIHMESLCAIAQTMLADQISQKHIEFVREGRDFVVMGEQRLLLSLLLHLCENAIRYNHEHGRVVIALDESRRTLCVRDNGIGIPPIYHERVFERFFCVDKSHSNMINGTGLGLSIVKHIAHLHHAKIELTSSPNVGTTIMLLFP